MGGTEHKDGGVVAHQCPLVGRRGLLTLRAVRLQQQPELAPKLLAPELEQRRWKMAPRRTCTAPSLFHSV